jgi:hypothetical protein
MIHRQKGTIMKRKIYQKLLDWRLQRNGETALLIEGARRIGKSYIVEEFAKKEYDNYLLIDFSSASEETANLFSNYMHDLDSLFERLGTFYKVRLIPRKNAEDAAKTLIIFDEIQFCPNARATIKHLVKDHRFDYIETGSLVSIKKNVKGILVPSEEHSIDMFPMDFEEFAWALGEEGLVEFIRKTYEKKQPMGALLHRQAMDLFRKYLIVGGMPQAVEKYIKTKDLKATNEIKQDIIDLYRKDIRNYTENLELKVTSVFDEIPQQLQKHDKKFRLSDLKKGAAMRDYSSAFLWLEDARIINCCFNSTAPSVGLRLNEDRTTVKCYMGDTGLLVTEAFGADSSEIQKKLMFDSLEFNEGMIIENAVAQMLRASGHPLFFYANSSREDSSERMEIDFLITDKNISSRHNICPIEVKSGKKYTITSLNKCRKKFSNQISTSYVLHTQDFEIKDNIVYLPIYMAHLL